MEASEYLGMPGGPDNQPDARRALVYLTTKKCVRGTCDGDCTHAGVIRNSMMQLMEEIGFDVHTHARIRTHTKHQKNEQY